MIGTMVKQLTEKASVEELEGRDSAHILITTDRLSVSASGTLYRGTCSPRGPQTYTKTAAEQKARSTYEYLIQLADDPDVIDPLRFLREREVVHFQRFGEALRLVQDYLGDRKRVSMRMPDKKR